jgi:hypothetical protein
MYRSRTSLRKSCPLSFSSITCQRKHPSGFQNDSQAYARTLLTSQVVTPRVISERLFRTTQILVTFESNAVSLTAIRYCTHTRQTICSSVNCSVRSREHLHSAECLKWVTFRYIHWTIDTLYASHTPILMFAYLIRSGKCQLIVHCEMLWLLFKIHKLNKIVCFRIQ